jgi:non-specific serine/threonine protein kinase
MVARPNQTTTPLALPASGHVRHTLPLQPTALIGRDSELAALRARLLDPEVRLLTLTGPPGTGKTRLAIAAAARGLDDFADGACFVGLESVAEPDGVVVAIAQALRVREVDAQPLAATLAAYLRGRQMLLLLDNFEQVLPAGAHVAALLAACPELKVLVTSRAPLRLRWEQEFPVAPLALPDGAGAGDPAAIAQASAVELFVRRARAVVPEFCVTPENADAVAAICARLDGLPLAIELAAARLRLLPPQAMLARLAGAQGGTPLQLLADGPRDLPGRQQTLRAALAWSYELLTADQRALFRRLGVFAGGCTLEAAMAVAAAAPSPEPLAPSAMTADPEPEARGPEPAVEDGLAALLGDSLLRMEVDPSGEARYRMLETLREYALERLTAAGESDETRRRHADYFMRLAETAQPQLQTGGQQTVWLGRLDAEHENLRAALAWASGAEGGAETALRLGGALFRFWSLRGYLSEGRHWLDRVVAAGAGAPAPARKKALNAAGLMARLQGDHERAAALHQQCLGLARQQGDPRSIAVSLHNLALVEKHGRADYAKARALYEESLAIWRELGDAWGISGTLNNLGGVAILTGEYADAETALEESLSLCRAIDDVEGIAHALGYLGMAALRQGDAGRAMALVGESLTHYATLGDRQGVAQCLADLAAVAAARDRSERAARLLGAAASLREAIALPPDPADRPALEATVAGTRMALGEAGFAAAWEAGRALSLDEAVAEALSEKAEGGGTRSAGDGDEAAGVSPDSSLIPHLSTFPNGLTRREVEVLRLIAAGHSNPEIAQHLVLSVHTVERHTVNIYAKIGARGRAEAIAFAHRHGLAPT